MDTERVIATLQSLRGGKVPQQSQPSFSFEQPHSCRHCDDVSLDLAIVDQGFYCWPCQGFKVGGSITSDGERGVCPDCGNSSSDRRTKSARFSAKLRHRLPEAIESARFGCHLFDWIIGRTVHYLNVLTAQWEEKEAMELVISGYSFRLSALCDLDDARAVCLMAVSLVSDSHSDAVLAQHGLRRDVFVGELRGWTTATDATSPYIKSRPYDIDVMSARSVAFARDCLQACIDRHIRCRQDQLHHNKRVSEAALGGETVNHADVPTRLIDTRSRAGPSQIQLVDVGRMDEETKDSVSREGFVALSYCWGGDQPVKLTGESYEALSTGVGLSDLPQTLQDAVKVVRLLELRYLWIDCLCILQDDEVDKELEISRMARYYSNAKVTICAASAWRSVDGFLGVRRPRPFAVGPIRLPVQLDGRGQTGHVYLLEETDPPVEPTATRGWTLQESLLSRRILIFASTQLYWSCTNSLAGSGGEAAELIDRVTAGPESLVRDVYPMGSLVDRPTWNQWNLVVEMYTSRNLGFPGDKLLAVSALAEMVAAVGRHRGERPVYAAGLLADLDRPASWLFQLMWRTADPDGAVRARGYRAPSWSWASVDGPVVPESFPSTVDAHAAVQSHRVDLSLAAAPYGAVVGGRLVLAAPTHAVAAAEARWPGCRAADKGVVLRLRHDTAADKGRMAAAMDGEGPGDDGLLLVAMYGNGSAVRGLVVERMSEAETFARRGTFVLEFKPVSTGEIDPNRFFAEAVKRTICII